MEKLHCDAETHIEPFDVKKGDTFASACYKAKLVKNPAKNKPISPARCCSKLGLFAIVTSLGTVMTAAVSAELFYNTK
jgi:hypothetical protein